MGLFSPDTVLFSPMAMYTQWRCSFSLSVPYHVQDVYRTRILMPGPFVCVGRNVIDINSSSEVAAVEEKRRKMSEQETRKERWRVGRHGGGGGGGGAQAGGRIERPKRLDSVMDTAGKTVKRGGEEFGGLVGFKPQISLSSTWWLKIERKIKAWSLRAYNFEQKPLLSIYSRLSNLICITSIH